MKYFVVSSNKYNFLLKSFAYCFNKNWNDKQEVVVLCYNEPEDKLPSNFTIHSLGRQEDYGKFWTNALIPFFRNLEDNYFWLGLEDDFVITPVNFNLLNKAEKLIQEAKADKVITTYASEYVGPRFEEDFAEWVGNYRTTLMPSIWTRGYLLRYLIPNQTPWQFELINSQIARNDNAKVIMPYKDALFYYFGVYKKGKFDYNSWINEGFENMVEFEIKEEIFQYYYEQTIF